MADAADNSLYVTGLPAGCNEAIVQELFGRWGSVLSLRVLPSHPQKTSAAAIVSMQTAENAAWIIANISGTVPQGLAEALDIKQKNQGWGGKGGAAPDAAGEGTLYVSGLPQGFDDNAVQILFAQFGPVKSVKVLRPHPDKSDVAAIVSMESPEQAKMLIENVSGTVPQGLSQPIMIKAKMPSWDPSKGWGKGGYGNMDPWVMMQMLYMKGGKGGGKGMMKGGFGGGGGLSNFSAEKKVWVGGLPEDVTFQELKDHFGEQAKFALVMKGKAAGTGGVGFGSAEEATAAIQTLNGSAFKGQPIVVDVWTKKDASISA